MRNFEQFIYFICFQVLFAEAVKKDFCDRCMKIEQCPWFANLNKHEQQMWSKRIPCSNQKSNFGFYSTTKRDFICCPESSIWKKKGSDNVSDNYARLEKFGIESQNIYPVQNNYGYLPLQLENSDVVNAQPITDTRNLDNHQQNERKNNNFYKTFIYNNVNDNLSTRLGQEMNEGQQTQLNLKAIYNTQQNRPIDPHYQSTSGMNSGPGLQRSWDERNTSPVNQYSWQNTIQIGIQPGVQNSWQNNNEVGGIGVQNANTYSQQYSPNFNNNGNANLLRPLNRGDTCEVQRSLLPNPVTGCCGQDTSNINSITDLQNLLNIYAPYNRQSRPSQQQSYQIDRFSQKQEATVTNNTVDIELDNRIAGGRETELEQFPWTTLLESMFDYGYKQTIISCGGLLISSRYMLTAGHCVYQPNAGLLSVQIVLAEYDKRTFPRDCIAELGKQPRCIDNVLMQAENVILHPLYDDNRLQNDIALIRLQGFAPYTSKRLSIFPSRQFYYSILNNQIKKSHPSSRTFLRYTSPICLPPINIDNNNFFNNLPLAVAGWGRNGPYATDIKQSTVLRLIPHTECQKFYPYLSNSHLCAAGSTGEDTCKGDSGGPLMMLFRGSYYVVGIVSGKRADAPCGTSIPSLYTNVYRYLTWITSNIKT